VLVGVKTIWLAAALACSTIPARADRAEDLARIHVEAIGGRERIAALHALRASGTAFAAGKIVQFTMTAARPAKVRVETEAGGRKTVQASDGVEPPWELDTATSPPKSRLMPEMNARTFLGDAEFDDPLVAGADRGFTLDYAGEMQVRGRKLHRLLVTRKFTETFALFVDDETYFIVMRMEERTTAGGRKLAVVTHYEDFRPVDGVLLPHQITLAIDGKMTQQTKITRVEANPPMPEDFFQRPRPAEPAVTAP